MMEITDNGRYIINRNDRYFEMQFDLAEKTQLPMFLHMRAAATDFIDILFSYFMYIFLIE